MKTILPILACTLLTSNSYAVMSLDLKSGGTGTINSAVFETTTFQSTGTGVFNPFLDLKHQGNEGSEAAYNSGEWPLSGDNHRDHWNSNLRYDELFAVERGGTNYFLFTLDANETGGGTLNKLLAIDRLQIYQSASANLNPGVGNLSGLGSLQWDMDASDDWRVLIDSSLGSAGSGDADLNVFIPTSFFDPNKEFVYLFNANGESGLAEIKERGTVIQEADGLLAHAGFEEWSALRGTNPTTVPDGGASLGLMGLALAALGLLRRKLG